MAAFIKLDDSPMFRKQMRSLEHIANELKDRCQILYNGCKKFVAALGEAYNGDIAFAESLEAFGGGNDDLFSISVGGPIISKFISAFQEMAAYKDLLHSQVEHMLSDHLTEFMKVDLEGAKECRRRFDKATHAYDQAREKFTSLKKGTRLDIVAELEEDLQNSKSSFERCRFNLVNALTNVEAKKKYLFLESLSAIMDAHLRYFKLGYGLLSQMEPFIHQILTYTQQSKEMTSVEQDKLAKRIQEYRTQMELDNLRASSNVEASTSGDGIHVVGMSSYKEIEALMQSTANGEVQTIKQGYLLKRATVRGDWKRKFFVLDSHGALYYYRNNAAKPAGSQSHQSTGISDHGSSVFSRFRARHNKTAPLGEENLGCRTIDLRTSTIKIDAEHTDLRLCFRIISPSKTYTLQTENEADRKDWVDKITGVIAALLNSPFIEEQVPLAQKDLERKSAVSAGYDSLILDSHVGSEDDMKVKKLDAVSRVLREISGNDLCAECCSPEPEWASLNLGILLCIECSGVHRNLGVHISKVRSITLDVKVWEPVVLDLFRALGNAYCNSVWEELLHVPNGSCESNDYITSITKPGPKDALLEKEKYIQSKYVDKVLVVKEATEPGNPPIATRIWEAVKTNNLQSVYRMIVVSDVNINTIYDEVDGADLCHLISKAESQNDCESLEEMSRDPAVCQRIKDSHGPENCLQGCSLLHLACHVGNPVMLELLLQFGADINLRDFHGRTPLHHCISKGYNSIAKYILRRGARPSIEDGGGQSALERAMEIGAITDEELFILLTGNE
ncbi:PREDICTED: ADP-ribosylation factor GTPase-activating protein AGD4-like isoform X3 [Nelumbo nucifera]|uniref:ADP-ribosylation factor GTPase-activating protein AGD4-like isoform X3 n=1 Tax=Nelumbo nucifera TaxID=4432 RepID=A0A1U8BJR1_NELNU|nr:PREDICTED: ADP-ribosylation factor GTPase-activating protein AGD4-like isoform X3 [Nelumbo nucifera]